MKILKNCRRNFKRTFIYRVEYTIRNRTFFNLIKKDVNVRVLNEHFLIITEQKPT